MPAPRRFVVATLGFAGRNGPFDAMSEGREGQHREGVIHCVLLHDRAESAPDRLLRALGKRGIEPYQTDDPYGAMAELCARGDDDRADALILLFAGLSDRKIARQMVEACEVYQPRASVWVFDPEARPELREVTAEDFGSGGGGPEITVLPRPETPPAADLEPGPGPERAGDDADLGGPSDGADDEPPPLRFVDHQEPEAPEDRASEPEIEAADGPKPTESGGGHAGERREERPLIETGFYEIGEQGVMGPGFSAFNLRPVRSEDGYRALDGAGDAGGSSDGTQESGRGAAEHGSRGANRGLSLGESHKEGIADPLDDPEDVALTGEELDLLLGNGDDPDEDGRMGR